MRGSILARSRQLGRSDGAFAAHGPDSGNVRVSKAAQAIKINIGPSNSTLRNNPVNKMYDITAHQMDLQTPPYHVNFGPLEGAGIDDTRE